jgi:2-polyprenyl-3-methyl-5-hydroxy-6-metoxy-1,4-benzoquinol methylase
MDASLYDELHRVEQTHWWFRARRQIVWSLVDRYIGGEPGRRLKICELGCGTGGNLAAVADKHDVVGIECSPQALAYARQSLGDRVQPGRLPNEINLPPASFDVVLLTDVLEHIENDTDSARSALNLLRPGGIVVATVPAYQWLYSPRDVQHHHFRRYSKQKFSKLWKHADAEVLLLSHYNTVLFAPAATIRMASKFVIRSNKCGDLAVPPRPINQTLAKVMGSEANLLGRFPMPFGLSLVTVTKKTHSTGGQMRTAA